jgi:hypothetical protein
MEFALFSADLTASFRDCVAAAQHPGSIVACIPEALRAGYSFAIASDP